MKFPSGCLGIDFPSLIRIQLRLDGGSLEAQSGSPRLLRSFFRRQRETRISFSLLKGKVLIADDI